MMPIKILVNQFMYFDFETILKVNNCSPITIHSYLINNLQNIVKHKKLAHGRPCNLFMMRHSFTTLDKKRFKINRAETMQEV